MINSKVGILFCLLSVYTFSQAQPKNSPPPPVAAEAKEISFDDLDLKTPEVKRNRADNNQDSDAGYSDAVRNLFKQSPQKESTVANQQPSQTISPGNDNPTTRNTAELSAFEKIEKLFSEDKLKDALNLSKQLAASRDVSEKSDGLYWLARIYTKDKTLNNTNKKAIDFLKQSADLGSVRSIAILARIYASFYQIPFYIAWNVEPDNKQSELYYNKLLFHPSATDEQRKNAKSAIQAATNAIAVEYIQSPKRTHRLSVVCLDSEYVSSFIDRPQGPWSDRILSNCRTQPITVTGDKLRVVNQWYRGSQRSKPTYIVRINAGSQIAFSFIDTP